MPRKLRSAHVSEYCPRSRVSLYTGENSHRQIEIKPQMTKLAYADLEFPKSYELFSMSGLGGLFQSFSLHVHDKRSKVSR